MDTKKAEEEPGDVTAPFVCSCAKCNVIVGDSYSFLSSHEVMRTITLTAASNIQRSADVYTAKNGIDIGSTYFSFTCANCSTALGRYYLTTSKDLDYLREKFTFNIDGINSYILGTSQHGTMPEPIVNSTIVTNDNIENAQNGTNHDVQSLSDEVYKLQHVVMALLERVSYLEQVNIKMAPPVDNNIGNNKRRK